MPLKSAVELALERLGKDEAPKPPLTEHQKAAIAEIELSAQAAIANLRIVNQPVLTEAEHSGHMEKYRELQAQIIAEIARIQADAEERKEAIRQKQPSA